MEVVKEGYKTTEVGVIPSDWEVKTLGDIGDVRMCKRIFNHQTSSRGDVPFFKIGTFGKEPDAFISRELYEDFKRKFSFPKEGSILISASGTIGRTVVYRGEDSYYQDSNIIWLENDEKLITNEYLNYVLKVVNYNTEGSTIKRLYNSIIKSSKFVRPPTLAEQRAISTALSDVDALIASLERLIEKKKAIKQGTMQELLTGKTRLAGFGDGVGYKMTEVGRIPEDWEVKLLPEVIDFIHGKAHERHIDKFGAYTVVNSKFISTEGRVAKYSNENFCPAKKGDVLTVLSDLPNGKALAKCYYVDTDNKYAVNQRICIWRSKNPSSKYLYFIMNRNEYFLKFDDGVTQTHILNHHIKACPIPLPPTVEEQESIALVIFSMISEIRELESKRDKYKQIKLGMMQELLTGKTRLINVSDR